uniref:Genome polyprotein n=1 Tax=Cosavirus F TaxID=2003652 RepID=A0A6B9UM18_9PICO|nr:polyprotein [Cosavirus F]
MTVIMGANNSKESSTSTGNEGVIVNNFYANQYYASIDASAQAVGTEDTPANGNVSGFLGLASSAFNALSFLASPKVENSTYLEDRIVTRQAGNTSVNSQASEGVLHGYGFETDSRPPTSCGDAPTHTQPGVSRAYVFNLDDWTLAQGCYQYQAVKLTKKMADEEFSNLFGKTMLTHAFHKTGYEVTLQVNTSPFHAGLLGLFLVPEFTRQPEQKTGWDLFSSYIPLLDNVNVFNPPTFSQLDKFVYPPSFDVASSSPEQFFLYPHQLINPKETNIATVRVPYVNVCPTSDRTVHNNWTAVIMVLSPLMYSSGASPTIQMTLSVTPLNPVFNGLRQYSNQSPIPTRPSHNQNQFNTTLPDCQEPCYGMTVTPPRDFLPPPIEDLLSLAKVPCFLDLGENMSQPYFKVSNTKSTTSLVEFGVTLFSKPLLNTLVSRLGKYFCNYRGSLQLDFISATTSLTRGKLLIAYTPPGAGKPANLDEAMQGTYSIWDIGLQSTFHFTIPFISVVDFRITAYSSASTVNADGWVSVWLLNPLTYPPDTPPTQNIVVMLSAGKDFSYRLPISPAVAQNPDGPHDNAESGTLRDTDAGLNSGHSVALPTNHSNCAFFFDRYRLIGMLVSTSGTGPSVYSPLDDKGIVKEPEVLIQDMADKAVHTLLTLSPNPSVNSTLLGGYEVLKPSNGNDINVPSYIFLMNGDRHLYNSAPFTYIHADLEVTVKPPKAMTGRWRVTWYPPGAPLDTTQLSYNPVMKGSSDPYADAVVSIGSAVASLNPTFYGEGENMISFSIPYCSPLSVLPLAFDGYNTYSSVPGQYGVAPAADYGVLAVEDDFGSKFYEVFVRYKNFKGYVPKTLPRVVAYSSLQPSTHNKTLKVVTTEAVPYTFHNKKLQLLAGDIEQNPGPVMSVPQAQGPVADLLKVAREPKTVENVHRLLTTLNTLMDTWNSMCEKLSDAKFFRDLLCLLTKLSALLFLCHNQGTTAYLAAAAIMVADGVTFYDWYEKIKAFLSKRFRTIPPLFSLAEGPDLRDIVTFFNAARGAQWMVESIRALISWLKRWLELEEENEGTKLERMLIESPKHCRAINEFYTGDVFVKPQESFDFIQNLVDLSTSLGKTQLANYFKKFTTSDSDACRPEPVVIVLRGRPGAGKSAAATVLAAAVSKVVVGNQSVYTLSPDTDHMDGYKGQFVTIMDDLGQNPDGEDFRSFCQMVSTTQYRPPMANLDDKGICFSSRLIIATTNLVDFNPITIADPRALDRRITYDIHVEPGPSACVDGKLDLEKALKSDGPARFPYTTDCPLLHTTGLTLTDLRSKKTMNIKDLVTLVTNKLSLKKTVSNLLDNLIAQGPKIVGFTKDDEGVVIVDCMEEWDKIKDKKRKQAALEMISDELKTQHELHAQSMSMLKKFLTGLGVVAAVVGGLVALKYGLSGSSEEKEKKEETSADGPYSGPAKKDIKTLNLKAQSPLMDMEKKILKNVLPFRIIVGGKPYVQTCLALAHRVILVNRHTVDSIEDEFYVNERKYHIQQTEVVALQHEGITDLVALKLADGPEFKSLVRHFAPYSSSLLPGTRLLILSNDDLPMTREGSFLRYEDEVPTNVGSMPYVMLYRASTYFGMCGSVVCTRFTDTPGILGLHCAGGGGVGVGTRLNRRMVECILDYFYPKQAEGVITSTSDAPYIHVPRVTKLRRTTAVYPSTEKYGPAALTRNDPRLNEGVDLDEVIFSKHKENKIIEKGTEIYKALEMAAEIYSAKFVEKDFTPLTVEEAILGIPGLDRLDPNTASGIPYKKTRRQMINFDTGQIVDDELKNRLGCWLNGTPPETFYQTFLKDEIRPIEKVKAGKTRIIDVPPLDHVIAFRMMFGRFIAWYHLNYGFDTGSAIGCDPEIAWASFGFKLAQYKYQYDFDYSNFDASHSESLFNLLRDVVFTETNGFDHRCSLLLDSLAVSTHRYENKMMVIHGGLPSGTAGTSVINTVLNNIIFKASLYYTYSNFEWNDVVMLAYGDDIVAASDYELDLTRVRDFMSRIGYKITPADKGEEFRPKCMKELQFLKRRFEKVAGVYAPVMETENLEAMLSWYKPGTLGEKLLSVQHLAHFSGEETYNYLFAPFKRDGFEILPWKQLHLEWLNKLSE